MVFTKEADFENALIKILTQKGWEKEIINYPNEQDLLDNWANILFENNRGIDKLNDYPLTQGEMQQIIEQIRTLRTPMKLNAFINGKTVAITRDNLEDKLHFGKEVSLKIYDRREIAAGQSRYQIVRQPRFASKSPILNDRRGDLMLLINGMPVIHIELKKSGIPVSEACWQIQKYTEEQVFTGLFSLVQIFVAMTPEETLYYANPGTEGKFNPDFYFHWADFNNIAINEWDKVASTLLSIPMAHQLIGFYTIADNTDGILKVLRSYQYYAANAISDKVSKLKWDTDKQRGGYIWHTTGSGKTMTSFKSAQLIANSKDADKVVFLMDRVELGTQSLNEYRNFADDSDDIQGTEDTRVLIDKLKSTDPANTLIVTSIQKMSNIKEGEYAANSKDIEKIKNKRIVFIIDEAHRSVFGEMLMTIKDMFPNAVFFGFTGTPITIENSKKHSTTETVFGNELHRYSIADAIRDKNVLGFDLYKVTTFKNKDLRQAIAFREIGTDDLEEIINDPAKSEIYYNFMDSKKIPMAGWEDEDETYHKGIEDYIERVQYETKEHQNAVADDIILSFKTLSRGNKFHAIFATSSINEAIEYYRLFKEKDPNLKITALFDSNIDNNEHQSVKRDGLVEIISDYNQKYDQKFSIATFQCMKKDIANRLAHKDQYKRIEREPKEQIDILIVVDQMLTGFDSKWVNTLYLDKKLKYENIIQALSRTNRLFGEEKPFGTIKYYRYPYTMERNIAEAIKMYSGDREFGIYVDKLPENIKKMNNLIDEIVDVFKNEGIENLEKVPEDKNAIKKFIKLFNEFNDILEAAYLQGFNWNKKVYKSENTKQNVEVSFTIEQYDILLLRYREIFESPEPGPIDPIIKPLPYDIKPYIIEMDGGRIDNDYMDSRFNKYLKSLENGDEDIVKSALDQLHQTFASLTKEEQKYADIFLHDIQRGDANLHNGYTFHDYITEYMEAAKKDEIHKVAELFGMNEELLREMKDLHLNKKNINEYGRFDKLKNTVNMENAKEYLEFLSGEEMDEIDVYDEMDSFLRYYIIDPNFEVKI